MFFLRSCVHSDIGVIEWPMSNPIPPPPLQPTYVANIFVPMFANVFVPMFTQCFCPVAEMQAKFSAGGVSGCKFGNFQIPGNRSDIAVGSETDTDNCLNIKSPNIASSKS